MILFPRAVARDFNVLFGRCRPGRPRGPDPPVVVRLAAGTRTVAATTPDGVTLTHTAAAKEADDLLVLPAAVLAESEGGTDEPVTLDRQSKLRGSVHWPGGGKPRKLPVELILPGRQHDLPEPPELHPVPPALLAALHECGRTAARESGRFALSKVQVQGKAGRVVGTDGRTALLYRGLALPFAADVLVPAVPVFGAKPLARSPDVRVGRTATHLVVAAGPWAVWLPTDATARFPDVAGVVPRDAPTVCGVDGRDAAELLRALPGLPGGGDEHRPVTVDAGGVLRVRGRADDGRVGEVTLTRSPTSGPPVRVAVDRRVLARGLALGGHTLRLTPDRPVVIEGDGFTLIAVTLDAGFAVPPTDTAPEPVAEPALSVTRHDPITPSSERSRPMPHPETNGHAPRGDPADPLDLAEELRASLADAAAKAARLVAALRQSRKEKKVLSAVLTNLKQLNLGTGGPR